MLEMHYRVFPHAHRRGAARVPSVGTGPDSSRVWRPRDRHLFDVDVRALWTPDATPRGRVVPLARRNQCLHNGRTPWRGAPTGVARVWVNGMCLGTHPSRSPPNAAARARATSIHRQSNERRTSSSSSSSSVAIGEILDRRTRTGVAQRASTRAAASTRDAASMRRRCASRGRGLRANGVGGVGVRGVVDRGARERDV